MRGLALVLGLVPWLGGCQEYSIVGGFDYSGRGDAPPLETPTKTDIVSQTTVQKVDLLWVVDNSCSMEPEQNAIAANFDRFLEFFVDSGLDWHLGVITTDAVANRDGGRLRQADGIRYITSETPDPLSTFRQMVRVGTDGDYNERGLMTTWQALSQPTTALATWNEGFYRDEASLHIVVVSDEDDASDYNEPGESNDNQLPFIDRFEFINFLRDLKPSETIPVTFSSIVCPLPNGCNTGPVLDRTPAGAAYLAVTDAIGGIKQSIVIDDWSPVLEELGLAAAGLRSEYFLTEVPVPGTVEVWIDDGGVELWGIDLDTKPEQPTIRQVCRQRGHEECFGYYYDPRRNSVVFPDFLPTPMARVHISYALLKEYQPPIDDTDAP